MTRRLVSAVIILWTAACGPPRERQVLLDAAAAMGGADRIQNVRAFTIDGTAVAAALGENRTPDGELPTWRVAQFSRSIDLIKHEMRVRQARTAPWLFADDKRLRLDEGLDDEVAFDRAPDGTVSRVPTSAVRERRIELLHHPLTLVWTAIHDSDVALTGFRQIGSERIIEMTTARDERVTIAFDRTTKLPLRARSITDQPNLGDAVIETVFDDYEDADGIKMPKHLRSTIDRFPRLDLNVSQNTFTSGDLAATTSVFVQPAELSPTVTAERVAKGIWWLAGSGAHRSVLFEFDDHLVLFEAPADEARSRAVFEKARMLSNKPLTHVIVSHHHFEHSGGLRAAVAEGLTIVTYRDNIPWFKELLARKHSIVPDELAARSREPHFVAVDDSLTLKDSAMELQLYHALDNPHEGTNIFAYVPHERILVQADLFDSTLVENVETIRKLRVDKQVPVDGSIQTWADTVKTIRVSTIDSDARRRPIVSD